jgi:hypothetical protein
MTFAYADIVVRLCFRTPRPNGRSDRHYIKIRYTLLYLFRIRVAGLRAETRSNHVSLTLPNFPISESEETETETETGMSTFTQDFDIMYWTILCLIREYVPVISERF